METLTGFKRAGADLILTPKDAASLVRLSVTELGVRGRARECTSISRFICEFPLSPAKDKNLCHLILKVIRLGG